MLTQRCLIEDISSRADMVKSKSTSSTSEDHQNSITASSQGIFIQHPLSISPWHFKPHQGATMTTHHAKIHILRKYYSASEERAVDVDRRRRQIDGSMAGDET